MRLSKNRLYNFIHYSTLLLIIHGSAYFIVKTFFKIQTEYGLRPNDWQSFWQGGHVLLSPLSVFTLGLLWISHILKNFKANSDKRVSGILLTTLFIIMILTGYILQISYDEKIKVFFLYAHLIISALFTIIYTIHILSRFIKK